MMPSGVLLCGEPFLHPVHMFLSLVWALPFLCECKLVLLAFLLPDLHRAGVFLRVYQSTHAGAPVVSVSPGLCFIQWLERWGPSS